MRVSWSAAVWTDLNVWSLLGVPSVDKEVAGFGGMFLVKNVSFTDPLRLILMYS